MFMTWWKEIHGKVIPAFIENLVEDEKYVDKDDRGNFMNVFIRRAELQGKIGSIELESADQLPISWAQKKDMIMQLLASANPLVQKAITAPENLELLKDAVGINDFVMPGESQREYQYEEINALVNSAPTMQVQQQPNPVGPMLPPMQVPQLVTSVDINPFDDHTIHAEICAEWLASDAGRLCKTENQQGYANVLLHWQKHNQMVQQAQMQAMQMQEQINQSKTSQPKPGDEVQPVVAPVRQNINT